MLHLFGLSQNEGQLSEEYFDKFKYQEYVDRYLKVPNSPDIPLWEIFTENIKKIYNDKNKLN